MAFNPFCFFMQAPDDEVEAALNLALEAGYRHIDCAPVYLNEKAIGRVLKSWLDSNRVTREELFIVTKLPPLGKMLKRKQKYILLTYTFFSN